MIIHCNKLVRDKIPEIIDLDGYGCITEILSNDEYLKLLNEKLDEEVAEYHRDGTIEELADIVEVIYAIVIAKGFSVDELEKIRIHKLHSRGGFEKKIYLSQMYTK